VLVQRSLARLHQPERLLDVLLVDFGREPQPRARLRDTQDAEERTRRSVGKVLTPLVLLPLSAAEADVFVHDLVGDMLRDRRPDLTRERDVMPQNRRRDRLERERWRFLVHVHVGDVLRQALVVVAGRRVEDQEEEIETGQKRGRQIDVVDGGDFRVVAAVQRIGGGQDGSTSVQRGRDTGLGDGNGLIREDMSANESDRVWNFRCAISHLLLHDFVNGRSVRLVHLVKLVDTANAVVGKDERSSLCAIVLC
jgi:hypothetical protein